MSLVIKKRARGQPEQRRKQLFLLQKHQAATAPREIWLLLERRHQEQIFRGLVIICDQLVKQHHLANQEMNNDEPR